ncbi:uncharacterized protein YukE [Nocardia sp. GAS34]|uniref:hypothetical protein n=1 Tax=unclassified Nocardia TaxID=2637762 RepID=UPI003D1DF7FC
MHPDEAADSYDWEILQKLGEQIPTCTAPIENTARAWHWAANELNVITGYTTAKILGMMSDGWQGKTKQTVTAAMNQYRTESKQLVADMGNVADNLRNNVKLTLENTHYWMPPYDMAKPSDSATYQRDLKILNGARWAMGAIYNPGFVDAANAMPRLAPPKGLANPAHNPPPPPPPPPPANPTPAPATPGANTPTPGTKSPNGPGASKRSLQDRAPNPNVPPPGQNSGQDGLQQAAQALQQAAGAGQQALGSAQQQAQQKTAEDAAKAAAADAALASGLPGLAGMGGAGSLGGTAGALGKAAQLESDALQASRLFPRAGAAAAEEAAAEESSLARAGLAQNSGVGSPGAAGARGNQDREKERKSAVYLESTKHLAEALGQPVIGSVPVIKE